jgi:hypothetical protein
LWNIFQYPCTPLLSRSRFADDIFQLRPAPAGP